MSLRTKISPFVAAAILGAIPGFTLAANYTWSGQTGNWSDPGNWAGGNVPVNDPTAVATIQGNETLNQNLTSTLDASQPGWVLNGLVLHHSSNLQTPDQLIIDPGSTLQFVGTTPYLEQDYDTPVTVSGAIQIANGLTVNGTGQGAVVLNGPISGAGGIALTNNYGNLSLNGVNTFAGGITFAPASDGGGPSLTIGTPAALGSGNVTIIHPSSPFFPMMAVNFQTSAGNVTQIANTVVVSELSGGNGNITFNAAGNGTSIVMQHLVTTTAAGISFGASNSSLSWTVQSLNLGGNLSISGSATLSNISETTASTLTLGSNFTVTVHLATANVYTGGTVIGGNVYAEAPGAFGSGPVTVNGTVFLDATSTANNTVSGTIGIVHYNANGGAGGHLISTGTGNITFGANVTNLGGDSFSIGAGGIIGGTDAQLALLDRGTGSGTTANFSATFGSMLENTDGGLPTAKNLGSGADLIAVVHTSAPLTVAVGTGTPWAGINAGQAGFIGTLVASSNLSLGGYTFGNGGNASFSITPAGGAPVVVMVQSATLNSTLSDFSGVSQFEVTGALTLSTANGLGGAAGTVPASVDVANRGSLSVSNAASLNANVTLHVGSTFTINAPGLTGNGTISRDTGPLTLQLLNASALTGSQISGSFLQAGDTVTLGANNLFGLKQLDPALHYVLNGTPTAAQQAEGFNINGGSLYFGGPRISLQPGPAARGDSAIRVGPAGATISSFGSTQVDVIDPWRVYYYAAWDSAIQVPILAQGPITFGNTTIPLQTGSGAIALTSTANQFNAVSVNNATIVAPSPAVLTGANFTLNGGILVLLSNVTNSSLPPTLFSNPINVTQNSVIADNTRTVSLSSIFPSPSGNHPIALSNVSLGNALLALDNYYSNMTIGSLTLTGNGTLTTPETSSNSLIVINGIGQADGTPRALTFTGYNARFIVNGNTTSTGAISLGNVSLEVDGTISRSTATFSVAGSATLTGNATILRPVVFSGSTLSPGTASGSYFSLTSTPGMMTFDSLVLAPNTLLPWNLGSPGGAANDFVAVNGDLTLDGRLGIIRGTGFGPGTYTLMTYGGSLTDNGLTLPTIAGDSFAVDLSTPGQVNLIVTAVPEPGTLAIAAASALLLSARRRRRA